MLNNLEISFYFIIRAYIIKGAKKILKKYCFVFGN
jgi:hypothetical protein